MKKVVIITGASSGIGFSCAEYFRGEGYIIYGLSRNIQSVNLDIHKVSMNINNDESVRNCIQNIIEKEHRIDIVINCAGIGMIGSLEDTMIPDFKSMFETNLFGLHRLAKEVIPIMRKQRNGHFFIVSSLAGLFAFPYLGVYSSTKFAIEGYSEALRMEVKKFGIKVILIEPGTFKTKLTLNSKIIINPATRNLYEERVYYIKKLSDEAEDKAPDIQKIPELIDKILIKKKPKLRYKIGLFSELLMVFLKNILPFKIYEKIITSTIKENNI